MKLRIGRRAFRRRPWLNLVPIMSAVDVCDGVDVRLSSARWYSLTFLTLTFDLVVDVGLRSSRNAWAFPMGIFMSVDPP